MTYNPVDWMVLRRFASADGRFVLYCSKDLNYGRDEPLYMWTLETPGPRGNEISGLRWLQYPEDISARGLREVRYSDNGLALEIVSNDGTIETRELPMGA
jgi:hypothetical protein